MTIDNEDNDNGNGGCNSVGEAHIGHVTLLFEGSYGGLMGFIFLCNRLNRITTSLSLFAI